MSDAADTARPELTPDQLARDLRVDIDGDETTCSLAALLVANVDGLSDEEWLAVCALDVGASISGGGGAAPVWTVTRVS